MNPTKGVSSWNRVQASVTEVDDELPKIGAPGASAVVLWQADDRDSRHGDVGSSEREQMMMKALRRVSILAMVAILATGGVAAANGTYHSERLSFSGGSDPAFHGQVVNIHANGPVNGALERYQVVGAAPSTDYEVLIQFCEDGGFADFTQTAVLTTDRAATGMPQQPSARPTLRRSPVRRW